MVTKKSTIRPLKHSLKVRIIHKYPFPPRPQENNKSQNDKEIPKIKQIPPKSCAQITAHIKISRRIPKIKIFSQGILSFRWKCGFRDPRPPVFSGVDEKPKTITQRKGQGKDDVFR